MVSGSRSTLHSKPGAPFNYVPADAARLARALKSQAICARHGVPMRAAAIQFPLAHPAVACVITGARTAEEIAGNERMLRVDASSDLWAELRSLGLIPDHAPTPA